MAKIADFGISQTKEATRVSTGGVSYATCAPEQVLEQKINEKVDVYSFAMLIWELLTGQAPFKELSITALVAAYLKNPNFRPLDPKLETRGRKNVCL